MPSVKKNVSRSMRFLTSIASARNPFTDETKYQDKKLKKKYAKLILAKTRDVDIRNVNSPSTPEAEDIIKLDRKQKNRQVEELLEEQTDLLDLERKLSPNQLKKHKERLRTASRRGGKSKRKSRKTRKISSFFQIF